MATSRYPYRRKSTATRKKSTSSSTITKEQLVMFARGKQQFLDNKLGEPNAEKLNETMAMFMGETTATSKRGTTKWERAGWRFASLECELRMLGLLNIGDELEVIEMCIQEREDFINSQDDSDGLLRLNEDLGRGARLLFPRLSGAYDILKSLSDRVGGGGGGEDDTPLEIPVVIEG